ncbi:MAG: hypothetical protein CMF50_06085 [Legionellales bacterium]|nr:hypothetical protein [Legionellales bacterium]|tara:strand:+ start:12976 stop:14715 length:1740 start_codon:yes stop_codon:yes gene_type:complete
MRLLCECLISGQTISVESWQGREGIDSIPQWQCSLAGVQALQLLEPVSLRLTVNGSVRHVHGIITDVVMTEQCTQLTLASRLALLKHQCSPQAFVNKPITDIATMLLRQAGFGNEQISIAEITEDSPVALWCQFPDESTYDCLQRLLVKYGYHYCVYHDEHAERVGLVPQAGPFPWLTAAHYALVSDNAMVNTDSVALQSIAADKQGTETLAIQSQRPDVAAGNYLTLKAQAHLHVLENDYLVISLRHEGRHCRDNGSYYRNKMTLMPRQQLLALPDSPVPTINIVSGRVISDNQSAELDAAGRYRVAVDFLPETSAFSHYPVARLQHYSAGGFCETGWHLPLQHNTNVLLAFDPVDTEPRIIASLPDSEQAHVVQAANAEQSCLQTRSQQALLFDDGKSPYMQLKTANESQLCLARDSTVVAHQAALNWQARGTVVIKSGNDVHIRIQQAQHHYSGGGLTLNTDQVETYSQSTQRYHSQTAIKLQAGQNLSVRTKTAFTLMSKATTQLAFEGAKHGIQVSNGSALVQASHAIQAQGPLCLQAGEARVEITSAGDIAISGNTIHFAADNTQIKGAISYV